MTRFDREIEAGAERAASLKLAQWVQTHIGLDTAPCPYPDHRATDWRLKAGGPTVCGICHPPVAETVRP